MELDRMSTQPVLCNGIITHVCLLSILLYVATINRATGKNINTLVGPFIAYVNKIYECGGKVSSDKITWAIFLRTTHFNPARPYELQRIRGNISGTERMSDRTWVRIVIDKRNSNQWKENAVILNFASGACTAAATHAPSPVSVIMGNLLNRNPCSVSPGVNVINDVPVNWSFPHFPLARYGEFRFRLSGGHTGQTLPSVCLVVECATVPKV